ncbi:putative SIMPL domain-containing protein [Seiridium cardinale]
MSPNMEIKLTGTGTTAERAILNVSASSHEVQTATIASSQVTSTAKAIRELITPHCPDNPSEQMPSTTAISHYSMSSLQTNSQIQRLPRSHTTDPQPEPKIVYTARADFTIKFADFSVLNELATKLSTMENVSIKRIDWHLTDATTDSIKAGTRKAAAKDAIARARDYAEVFGGMTAEEAIKQTIPLSVVESAHYQLSSKPQLHYGKALRLATVDRTSEELHFEPEDIRLEVKVEATFKVVDA